VCPIFQVSNVTGENLPLLRQFLNLLPAHRQFDASGPVEFQIDDTFLVPGVGTVVSGVLVSGTVQPNDTLLLGPDSNGHFQPAQVKSIHRKRVNVMHVCGRSARHTETALQELDRVGHARCACHCRPQATAGQSACFALKKIKRSAVRKGMVMLGRDRDPRGRLRWPPPRAGVWQHSAHRRAQGELAARRVGRARSVPRVRGGGPGALPLDDHHEPVPGDGARRQRPTNRRHCPYVTRGVGIWFGAHAALTGARHSLPAACHSRHEQPRRAAHGRPRHCSVRRSGVYAYAVRLPYSKFTR